MADLAAPGTAMPPNAQAATYETPRLVPFARGVYQVRNRVMLPGGGSPSLVGKAGMVPDGLGGWGLSHVGLESGAAVQGRFAQADPNATGMVLLDDLAFHGGKLAPNVDQFDLQLRVSDGAHRYQYLGSHPWTMSDPLGLFLLPGELSAGGLRSQLMEDQLNTSFGAVAALAGLFESWGMDRDAEVDWALDMSIDDDLFSPLAAMTDVAEDWEEDIEFEPGEDFVIAGARSARNTTRIAKTVLSGRKLLGKVYDKYSDAVKAKKGLGMKFPAHHILEARHLRKWRFSTDGPAVILAYKKHKLLSAKIYKELPIREKPYTKAEVWQAYQKVYAEFPEWLVKVKPYLK